jgi:Mg2+-importing ATPase
MKYIMMGTSSNFGNMFSVAGASMFLPFLPMLPVQILLNNFLYDLAGSTISTDHVDEEYLKKPKKMDVNFIKRFMLFIGPVSSIFDFFTFFIMIYVFHALPAEFQTAWFIESMCTQILVVFVIRTRIFPFYKSMPSTLLTFSVISIMLLAIILPFTFIGKWFGFVSLPWMFFAFLGAMVVVYLIMVEGVKYWFYKRYMAS